MSRWISPRTSGRSRLGCLLAAVSVVAAAGAACAEDLPSFRPGLWQYERTAGAQKFGATECLDPGKELRRQQAVLEKIGCKLTPIARAGSTWTYGADCLVKLPSGPMSYSKISVLTVESDTAYQVEERTTNRGRTASEVVTAHRVADCVQ